MKAQAPEQPQAPRLCRRRRAAAAREEATYCESASEQVPAQVLPSMVATYCQPYPSGRSVPEWWRASANAPFLLLMLLVAQPTPMLLSYPNISKLTI